MIIDNYIALYTMIDNYHGCTKTFLADIISRDRSNNKFGKNNSLEQQYFVLLLYFLIDAHYKKVNDVALGITNADDYYIPECIRKFFMKLGFDISTLYTYFL